ncbi:MAG TPA: hypothetical protein VL523_20465 [Terriglobia bacterium]|nr:hypothetical protein [Terriglobia bacterium]
MKEPGLGAPALARSPGRSNFLLSAGSIQAGVAQGTFNGVIV